MEAILSKAWNLTEEETAAQLESNLQKGLTAQEAARRLTDFGLNKISSQAKESLWKLLLNQFLSPLVWILAVAAGLAFVFQEWLEGFAVIAVILINALIGFFMEWQAIRSMNALRKLVYTMTRVYRDGQLTETKAEELVPGDLVFLEAGDIVPADCRVIQQVNLAVKEAALTGESIQVSKHANTLASDTSLADRRNLLFNGTTVTRGNAHALVIATGNQTELGKINQLAQSAVSSSTPLEKKLNLLSQRLLKLTLLLIGLIIIVGILQGQELYSITKTAIALGIAAIPEGLPIIATIALARGMLRLAQHNVLVKRLSAVETLGETEVIFTDKTGTLTENRLLVNTIVLKNTTQYKATGNLAYYTKLERANAPSPVLSELEKIAALCNNAVLNTQQAIGDPLEIALLEFVNANTNYTNLQSLYPRLKEIPFDSTTKMMGTLHKNEEKGNYLVCIKGAVEVILKECDYLLTDNGEEVFKDRDIWLAEANHLAGKGLRVLAFAYAEIEELEDDFFHNLTLVGLIGFLDPPRKEVKTAIQTCKEAGIKVVMVTGDHPETAKTIAFQTGLIEQENALVLKGSDLNTAQHLAGENLKQVSNTNVFARVSPVQKLELIRLYQEENKVVGMTGDGINDAPALKKSDIGIAMGERGTEAAKEVADLILKDDAFSSIVLAIKQGRGIFQNIRYFVIYLLSCNLSEILVVGAAALSNLAVPLLPLQILFINMVTDVFPALALGMTKEGDEVMKVPPRSSQAPIINPAMWRSIAVYAVGISISVLGVFLFSIFYLKVTPEVTNNLTFYTLILAQLLHVFNLPAVNESFLRNAITKNIHVWMAIGTCIVLVFLAYQLPITRSVLQLQLIDLKTLLVIIPFSISSLILVQLFKRIGWCQ